MVLAKANHKDSDLSVPHVNTTGETWPQLIKLVTEKGREDGGDAVCNGKTVMYHL